MSELFDSLCFRNGRKVELIVDGKTVPIIITDLEEKCISYKQMSEIKLTGMMDHRASAQDIIRAICRPINMEYKKVIFNNPATIVIWQDGTKTVVSCQKGDEYDPEKGLALCFMKKALGNKGNFNNILKAESPKSEV